MIVDLHALLVAAADVLEADPALATRLAKMFGARAPGEWLTLGDAGKIANVNAHVIRDAGRRGEIRLGKAGRRSVVSREELDRYLTRVIVSAPRTAANDPHDEAHEANQRLAAKILKKAGIR
jgi:hypothetical protein